jgi:hypothetical protein
MFHAASLPISMLLAEGTTPMRMLPLKSAAASAALILVGAVRDASGAVGDSEHAASSSAAMHVMTALRRGAWASSVTVCSSGLRR